MCATVSGGKRAQSHMRAKSSRRVRRLASRMTGADDDDVKATSFTSETSLACKLLQIVVSLRLDSLHYFPIQNRSKICASTSSGVRRPVTSSNAARAS